MKHSSIFRIVFGLYFGFNRLFPNVISLLYVPCKLIIQNSPNFIQTNKPIFTDFDFKIKINSDKFSKLLGQVWGKNSIILSMKKLKNFSKILGFIPL